KSKTNAKQKSPHTGAFCASDPSSISVVSASEALLSLPMRLIGRPKADLAFELSLSIRNLEKNSRRSAVMGLSLKTEEADRLARELSRLTGETMTDAMTKAMRERLERLRAAGGE
ncbi:type II toxin-antitoxin system VapB family antitoxin, partial [Sinorhizobium medicae]